MSDNGRIKYVDISKGLGIMMVLLGHSITLMANPVNKFILSFHMPLFFFISGMTFGSNYSIKKMIRKQIALATPIITAAILSFITEILCDVLLLNEKNISEVSFLNKLDNWFLITLMLSELVVFTSELFKSKLFIYLFKVVLVAIFFALNCGEIPYLKYVEKTCCAVIFMMLGKEIGMLSIELIKERTYKWFINPIVLCFFSVAFLSNVNIPIGMVNNTYGNKIIFLITAIVGIYMILLLSNYLCGSRFLEFCGKNSLYIFITHFQIEKIIITVWRMKALPTYYEYPYYLIVFAGLVCIDLPVVYWLAKYMPFLFGKFKNSKF